MSSLQAFESELKKYMAVEQEISGIAGVHNIGSLSLETQPLKYSLKSEASSWKAQFARNLHKQVRLVESSSPHLVSTSVV